MALLPLTLDRSLPDHLPSLYDSPSEDFYTGNENKLPLFSDIQLLQQQKKNPHSRLNQAFVSPSKSYYSNHTKPKHKRSKPSLNVKSRPTDFRAQKHKCHDRRYDGVVPGQAEHWEITEEFKSL